MAATGTVGILRALLTADATAYQKTMKQSADATKTFGTTVAGLGNTAQKVTPQLTRLEKSFQGDKLLYTANNLTRAVTNIGGAAKLTDREMEKVNRTLTEAISKYRALGQAAPRAMVDLEKATRKTGDATKWLDAKMVALGTAVGTFASHMAMTAVRSLVDFAREAFDAAGQIADLSEQTGLSTDSIQEMQAVAVETGMSLETFTNAAYKLGLAINGDDKSVGRGLKALGLEWEKLRGLSMDEQFRKVMDAAGKLGNEVERNRALVAIFGERLARELSKAVEAYDDVANAAAKSSRDQIEALDRLGDALGRFLNTAKTYSMSAMGVGAIFVEEFIKAIKEGGTTILSLDATIEKAYRRMLNRALIPPAAPPSTPPGPPLPDEGDLKRQQAAIDALRKSLNALGLVTKRDVNEALAEMAAVQRRAVADGLDLNTVLAAQLPLLKDLVDDAKASGINVDALAVAYAKAGDAWRNSIDPLFDQVKGVTDLAEATKHLREEAERLGGLSLPSSSLTAGLIWAPWLPPSQRVSEEAFEPVLTFWNTEFPETVRDSLDFMTRSMSTSLTDMFVGLRKFKDGFVDIWRSIRAAFSDILASMLNDFLSGFLRQMLSAMAGRALAGTALGSALGIGTAAAAGAGTAAAVGGAAAGGTVIAGTGGQIVLGGAIGGTAAGGAGMGAALAGLATNPFTIAAAGALVLGLGIAKKGWFRGGEEGVKVNPARDRFLAQFGGGQGLAELLTSVTGEPGGGRLFTALQGAKTMQAFTAASQSIMLLLQRRGVAPPDAAGRILNQLGVRMTAATSAPMSGAAAVPASVPAAAASTPSAVNMTLTIQAWDRSDLNDAFREEIIPRLKDALQLNQAGLTTAIRQVG